jgi:acetoin utilization protein AcuB
MLVKNWMRTPVITIDENSSMHDALKLLKENNIMMLPVMKKAKLVGIVTDRDLKRASASDATLLDVHELIYLMSKIKVKHLMTKNPITVPIDFTVEETAEVLFENKISGVPVLDHDKKLTGIITQMDLFKAMMALTGIGKKGVQFAFQLEDRPGSIKELTDIIRKFGSRMASILTTYENVPEGHRKVYIRIYQVNRESLPDLQKELRKKATMLYVVDHRENRREIYS